MILNPNCSEAVMRLKTDKLSEEELRKLKETIEKLEKDEDIWGETNWNEETVFGIKCIKIDGNAPFNSRDQLMEIFGKLPFKSKMDIEEEER